MATRRILYFTAEDHYLYRSVGPALELEAKFTGDDLGLSAFREYLRAQRGALFAVVADLAGEDFHEEQIPYVRGADREALLARRLAQRYRDTRLAAALSLGTVVTPERRNERVLLTSFTNTQQLTPWLDALEEAGTRLSGVYSVPLLAPALAAKLGERNSRVLLVSANRAGLRQCYGERATFEQALPSDARLVFRIVDYDEALRLVKLRRAPEGTSGEALFVHLAAHKPPAEQFASREDRRRYFLWQLQRGIVAVGVAGFCACALVGASRWFEVMSVRGQAGEQTREARSAAQQYERITSTFPVTDTSTENLKVAVVEFRRIAERSADPERAFLHVSRVLEQYPQFELESLRWSVGRIGELRQAGPKPAAPAAGQSDSAAVLVEVSGRVQATQRNDYRGITAQVQRFASALVGEGYELVRTQLPFDVTSEGVLTGDIGGATESSEAPRFTVTLARRLQ